MKPDGIEWFTDAIRRLPSDEPVANGQPGYNKYTTQKDHWLGWLDPNSGTGTYPRRVAPDQDARHVYNHIREAKMLRWLIRAAGVKKELLQKVEQLEESPSYSASEPAAIRKIVPWEEVASALAKLEPGKV